MSTLETNSIGKYNGNNVSIDDALRFKNYNTTERDALTSVAGDIIYNTSTSKVEYYDGSAWQQAGGVDAFSIEYLVIAGGGGGNTNDDTTHGSGGAGGGGWDRYSSTGKRLGKCGDAEKGAPYSACLSKAKARKLGPKGRASFVKRKRAAQKKAGDAKKGGERKKGQKSVNVKTGA